MINYGWQMDPQTWEGISAELHDASWQHVDFTEVEAAAVPEGASGVYALCACRSATATQQRKARAGCWSISLRRFMSVSPTTCAADSEITAGDHRPESAKPETGFGMSLTFWFQRAPRDRRKRDEATLIACFGPTCNVRAEFVPASVDRPVPIGIHDKKLSKESTP